MRLGGQTSLPLLETCLSETNSQTRPVSWKAANRSLLPRQSSSLPDSVYHARTQQCQLLDCLLRGLEGVVWPQRCQSDDTRLFGQPCIRRRTRNCNNRDRERSSAYLLLFLVHRIKCFYFFFWDALSRISDKYVPKAHKYVSLIEGIGGFIPYGESLRGQLEN